MQSIKTSKKDKTCFMNKKSANRKKEEKRCNVLMTKRGEDMNQEMRMKGKKL